MSVTATGTESPARTATLAAMPPYLNLSRNEVRLADGPLVVEFALAEDADVRITVHNSAGELISEIWNGTLKAFAPRFALWTGTNAVGAPVSSNVYVVRMVSQRTLLMRTVGLLR